MSDEIAIGVDLGTSYSCVAVVQDGQPMVIPNEWGELNHASCVSFLDDGSVLVGNAAKKNIIAAPEATVYSAKRLIGRYFFSDEVKKAQAVMPYTIVEGDNNAVRIQVHGQTYSLPEISALVLKEMKAVAETYLGREITKAVVTVPAYFNDNQRQATKDAGRIAGLEVLRILNEPTSAALAYGFGRDVNQRVVVYDLGGGTFDVSILEIGKDVFEVLSTAGDTYLGGDDFDDRIMTWLAEDFLAKTRLDLRQNKYCLQMLKDAAERAKIDVGQKGTADILCQGICQDANGNVMDLRNTLSNDQFNRMVMDLVQRTFKVCDEALQSARLSASEIDAVILVGGPTRLPIIRNSVKHYFQKEPLEGINPDQVVALGACLQAHALLDAHAETFLVDVTPLSLRIGTVGGYTEKVIEKNTPVPIDRSKTFTTSRDGQEKVKIRVYQGESNRAEECEMLGEFEFSGFRIGYRGDVKIEVTFEIDTNGMVNVSACDVETGQKTTTTLTLSSGMSETDIQRSIDATRQIQLAGHSSDLPSVA
ncbi:Hsp70 family protein [Stigmatella aurantiaca]|uniref:Chaperone protein DnaK n=1 Tax=Stigmatella aurantiaca (strain DW4/3-1) TaxID=378806 RepID=Q08N15_STIAD|nr:Hsp70 family protein [Stigmatella aurantiaca]ADO71293.1 Heat shock protein 70 family protein [Stigmatella aurantiaca DW4/3-1]EAU61875.1 heat shock protein Hsp70:Calcium-binding EF-hand [Stigmatella aurantiaca DW4/3-1]